jgi:hypothetical protein
MLWPSRSALDSSISLSHTDAVLEAFLLPWLGLDCHISLLRSDAEDVFIDPSQYQPLQYQPLQYQPLQYQPLQYQPLQYQPLHYLFQLGITGHE